jgi:hypothetical protein
MQTNINNLVNLLCMVKKSLNLHNGISFQGLSNALFLITFCLTINSLPVYSDDLLSDSLLLKTTWDQNWPYNKYCPVEPLASTTSNGHCPTGCVAVAMGQIMKYYNYPVSGIGNVSYTSSYGTHTVDFSKSVYAWPQMPAFLNTLSDTISVNSTAQSLYQCAVAVKSDFGIKNTGAGAQATMDNLQNIFGYCPIIRGKRRYSATKLEWDSLICREINKSRPVIYVAKDSASADSHIFVLDHYQRRPDLKIQYHCNWGWGGRANGYFRLDSLFANSRHYGNDSDIIIFRISPPTLPTPKNLRYTFTLNEITSSAQLDTFVKLQWDPVVDPKLTGYEIVHWKDTGLTQGYYENSPENPLATSIFPNSSSLYGIIIYAVRAIGSDSIGSLYSNKVTITDKDIENQLSVQWAKQRCSPTGLSMKFVSSSNQLQITFADFKGTSVLQHLKIEIFNCSGALISRLFDSDISPGQFNIPIFPEKQSTGYLLIKATFDNRFTVLRIANIN